MNKLILIAILGLLAGCGGSGGSDDGGSEVFNYAGRWRADLVVIKDECGVLNNSETPIYLINQDSSKVVVTNEATNSTFEGSIVDRDKFIAIFTANGACPDGSNGDVEGAIGFRDPINNTANVESGFDIVCASGAVCETRAVGTATRLD